MRKYISIKETADLIGVSPQTLRKWEKREIWFPTETQLTIIGCTPLNRLNGLLRKCAMSGESVENSNSKSKS
jgi:uncharacterized protein YjcR